MLFHTRNESFIIQGEGILFNQFTYENADYLLYAAANRSLDLTIDALGRDLVEYQVNNLRRLQAMAETHCINSTYFPCSSNGTLQSRMSDMDCYWRDMGCGHNCIDRILSQDKLDKLGLLPQMPSMG